MTFRFGVAEAAVQASSYSSHLTPAWELPYAMDAALKRQKHLKNIFLKNKCIMYNTDKEKNQQCSLQKCALNGKGVGALQELGG